MKIINCEQGTDEWFDIRKGKMTASKAYIIAVGGKGLDTYIKDIVADMFASEKIDSYQSKAMERGNGLEAQARSIYELNNDVVVQTVGFIEYSEYAGCSPDGLINDDGGLEIKCINNRDYFQLLLGEEKPDLKYIYQVQMSLMITGRKWWDLLYYNPNFVQSTLVLRQTPNEEMIRKIKIGLSLGEQWIENFINKHKKLCLEN